MTRPQATVGHLPLPGSLFRAIQEGRWKPPAGSRAVAEVFADEPDWVEFYNLETMLIQNRSFQTKSQEEIAEEVPGSDGGLGCDPSLAVIIGSLGADMPIVLDYRDDRLNPRVIYLGLDGWRKIADDFDGLARLLAI